MPIPWFVHRSPNSPIDFRAMDPRRFAQAVRERRCWVCGDRLGKIIAFVGGLLSAAQRLYADPPSHVECADFSVRVCPFLSNPTAHRRGADKPAHIEMPGQQVVENTDVTGIPITTDYSVLPQGILVAKEPREIRWFLEGRRAKRSEVQHAIQIAQGRDEVKRHPNGHEIVRKRNLLSLPAGD